MDIFHLKADYDLDIMQPRQTLATITTKSLVGLDEVLDEAKPDIVLVHGDTSTTFAGALAAFYHKIPVGHVEAGLRTFDKYSPFPEEMNRKLTGQIARAALCADRAQPARIWQQRALQRVSLCAATPLSMRFTRRSIRILYSVMIPSTSWIMRTAA